MRESVGREDVVTVESLVGTLLRTTFGVCQTNLLRRCDRVCAFWEVADASSSGREDFGGSEAIVVFASRTVGRGL